MKPVQRTKIRWAVLSLVAIATLLAFMVWYFTGGRDQIFLVLQPGFHVRQIDLGQKTITVFRVNQTFVLDCQSQCGMFVEGKTYHMLDRGGILEYRTKGRRITMPVLSEHIDFEMPPGGHG